MIVSSLYILTRQNHARGKKRTVPFLNFLYLSSMSTWLLCILFCPCDFFQDSSTGTGGIQKRELGRERSSHNKSNISFMNRIVCLPFQPPDSFFYLSIKFGSFVYFFFFFPSFFFCCIIAISINIWYKIFIVRDVNTDEISIILRIIISSLAAFFWKSLIVYFFLFFFLFDNLYLHDRWCPRFTGRPNLSRNVWVSYGP